MDYEYCKQGPITTTGGLDDPLVDAKKETLCVTTEPPPPPPEEKKFPWGTVAIGTGALAAIIGLVAAAKKG